MFQPLDGPATYGALTVNTTAVELKINASPLEDRKVCTVQPLDGDIYFGYNNSVTTSTGTKIYEGQVYVFEAGDTLPIYLIAASSINCRITEVA